MDKLEKQRIYRSRNGNWNTKKYEKTHKGFLMRLYRNMQSRIYGVQKYKFYLYEGKELLNREVFYNWAFNSPDFYKLFDAYKESGFNRKLAPSVDRIDSSKGYSLDNMEWVTTSENSRRGALNKDNKIPVRIFYNDVLIGEFKSIQDAANQTEFGYFDIYHNAVGTVKSGRLKVEKI